MEDPGAVPAESKPRRRPPLIAVLTLVIVGLALAGGGAAGLAWGHYRKPTPAQVNAAGQRALALQWRWLRAGQIFPAKVRNLDPEDPSVDASLVGIAPEAPCGKTVDPKVARVLAEDRCVTMLRATYVDDSGTVLITIGVAVFPGTAVANDALSRVEQGSPGGLLPVGFPHTVTSQFTIGARETDDVLDSSGPYLVLYAAGYTDGRKTSREIGGSNPESGETVTTDIPQELSSSIAGTLSPFANPCAVREVRC